MPSLAGLRWNPIVTVLNPTSAMIEDRRLNAIENDVNPAKKAIKATETSANNHT